MKQGRVVALIALSAVVFLAGCGDGHHESRLDHLSEHDTHPADVRNVVRRDTTAVKHERGPLYTLSRIKQIEKYPCSNCHVSGVEVGPENRPENRRAHWDLKLNHGDGDLTCASCHVEDDMDSLKTFRGDTVSYDKSYKVCGQCHFEQLKDWKGGAHGKQVKGWGTPRVIYNCSTCHDPHDPGYEKRWPVTYPSVPRTVDDHGS